MRILWVANAPWAASGYGEQTALFVKRLQALGHEVAISCNWGLDGAKLEWQGITCYPSDGNWNNTNLAAHVADHRADVVIALMDAWVMNPDAWPDTVGNVAIWAPIDHYPIPPAVLAVLAHPRVRPIAMSRFGEQQMNAFNLDPLYVPHGVDRSVFRPRPEIRSAVRAELGIPADAFLVGMVAANKGNAAIPRKGFPQAFQAFAQLAGDHDDAWLYVHSQASPGRGGGLDLDRLARVTGCPIDRTRFPGPQAWHLGMSNDVVAAIYQAFDVLLMPSMGEGFGIPLLEAQACGVPVIASDHSAMNELAQVGWLVDGDPWWDELQASFFIAPSIASIRACLEDAYVKVPASREAFREAAAEFAAAYDADTVTSEFWVPALERLADGADVPPLPGVSRQVRRAAERQARKKAVA